LAQKIVIALPKGGVGKTTVGRNLAEALAARGKRVLLVEMDPQGNLTQGFGLRPRKMAYTIYTAMAELVRTFRPAIHKAIVPVAEHIDLIPANVLLNRANDEFASAIKKETLLQRLLQPVEENYEVMITDTLPYLGLLVNNGLAWADEILIPLQAEADAIESTALLLEHLKQLVSIGLNEQLAISGLLLNQVDLRTRLNRSAMEFAQGAFGPYAHFFDQVIPRSIVYPEARAQHLSIFQYQPGTRFARVYEDLATAVLSGEKRTSLKAMVLEEGFLDRIFEGAEEIEQEESAVKGEEEARHGKETS
jgi:chromosome partitioning protein